jgi:Zn-dependent protease with chaperone function
MIRPWKHLLAMAVLASTCAASLVDCLPGMACATSLPGRVPTERLLMLSPVLLVIAAILAFSARATWLLVRTRWAIRRFSGAPPPLPLLEALNRTGVRTILYLEVSTPIAFCSGVLRNQIVVSRGTVSRLRPEELDAVLLHEAHHAAKRDPMIRAILQSASEVLFFIPLMEWWANRQVEASECRADLAAVSRLGIRPVAGALVVLGSGALDLRQVAFAGASRARAAQLLGEQVAAKSPSPDLWAVSGVGCLLLLTIGWCLGQIVASI